MRNTINTKNKNLFTISMKSKTKLTLFTINYKKNNLQKNYIRVYFYLCRIGVVKRV